jgi:hypothetical protein
MGMFICQWCVAQASELAVEHRAEGSMRLEVSGLEVRCSFCGKEACQGCSWSQRSGGAPGGSLARALGSATSPWTCAGKSWPTPHPDGAGWGELARAHPRGRRRPLSGSPAGAAAVGAFWGLHERSRCRPLLGLAALLTSNAQRPDGERTPGYIALLRQLGVFARDCVDVMLLRG